MDMKAAIPILITIPAVQVNLYYVVLLLFLCLCGYYYRLLISNPSLDFCNASSLTTSTLKHAI